MVQAVALGIVASLAQAREMVRRSFPVEIYEPTAQEAWDNAWQRFRDAIRTGSERRLA